MLLVKDLQLSVNVKFSFDCRFSLAGTRGWTGRGIANLLRRILGCLWQALPHMIRVGLRLGLAFACCPWPGVEGVPSPDLCHRFRYGCTKINKKMTDNPRP